MDFNKHSAREHEGIRLPCKIFSSVLQASAELVPSCTTSYWRAIALLGDDGQYMVGEEHPHRLMLTHKVAWGLKFVEPPLVMALHDAIYQVARLEAEKVAQRGYAPRDFQGWPSSNVAPLAKRYGVTLPMAACPN